MKNLATIATLASLLTATTSAAPQRSATATVTAYCPCAICCGPMGGTGITASGQQARQGVTVAASRGIPFGTRLRIEGVGVRVVQDRLATRHDGRVDVYFARHEDAVRFGKKTDCEEIEMSDWNLPDG